MPIGGLLWYESDETGNKLGQIEQRTISLAVGADLVLWPLDELAEGARIALSSRLVLP